MVALPELVTERRRKAGGYIDDAERKPDFRRLPVPRIDGGLVDPDDDSPAIHASVREHGAVVRLRDDSDGPVVRRPISPVPGNSRSRRELPDQAGAMAFPLEPVHTGGMSA